MKGKGPLETARRLFRRYEHAPLRRRVRRVASELSHELLDRLLGAPVARDLAIEVTAAVASEPPRVTLVWPSAGEDIAKVTVRRRPLGETDWASWETPHSTLDGGATSFADHEAEAGVAYEYQVERSHTRAPWRSMGRVAAGFEVPFDDAPQRLILVVDESVAAPLAFEIERLQADLAADGYEVIDLAAARDEAPASVRAKINAAWQRDPERTTTVFLLGHVPVPYSGDMSPDGHEVPRPESPPHRGAWPADVYYGDMQGEWTDSVVDTRKNPYPPSRRENENIPGDGKLDQDVLPTGRVDLAVGRVDLAKMPAFSPLTEVDLLRRYLDKDHRFRHAELKAPARALVDDHFGYGRGPVNELTEGYATGAFRMLSAMFGGERVTEAAFFDTLAKRPHLWAHACGPGQFDTCRGVGVTRDFKTRDPKAIFMTLFGSYFGDFDAEDCFLRAPLATSHGLVSTWSGGPDWCFHPMALGKTTGFCARLTQHMEVFDHATKSVLRPGAHVHVALMGDPTLRLFPVMPPSALSVVFDHGSVKLAWKASVEASCGYHVYRGPSRRGPFVRLTEAPARAPAFVDPRPTRDARVYLVRAVALVTTPSGSFFAMSQGNAAELPESAMIGDR